MAVDKRRAVHFMFDVAVAIKVFNGVVETVCGVFLIVKPGWIGPHVVAFTYTLFHDPDNWVVRSVARWGAGLSTDTEHFASVYLIAHGVAKMFIGWALLQEKLWAFPVALGAFGLLILYQLERLLHTNSVTLATLIIVDLAVCYLIWREYGFRRADVAAAS